MAENPQTKPTDRLPWHPLLALVFIIVLYFVAPIVGGILVSIYPLLHGWTASHTNSWLNNSVYAQFFYVLLSEALTIAGLLAYLKYFKRWLPDIGFKKPRPRDFGIGLIAYPVYFVIFLIVIEGVVTRFLPQVNVNQTQELGFNNIHGFLPLALTFISLVILPPLVEEITVRGFLFTSLRQRLAFVPAMVATSLAFAAAHLPEGGAAGPLYIAAIDTFILSLVLCFVREKTGSLWAGITLHAIKNGIAYAALFIFVSR